VDSHRVVDVVQPGYTLHGEVLRPAQVTGGALTRRARRRPSNEG
jgi:hypothetical protein